jgi:hypothetical protein
MFMHHNFKICVDKGWVFSDQRTYPSPHQGSNFQFSNQGSNEWIWEVKLVTDEYGENPAIVTSTRFMFVSTHDKHVLESAQTVHYRTSVAKQHV